VRLPFALAAAAVLAALCATAAVSAAGDDAPPPCEIEVSVDPARAVPGQQVTYRLRLLLRDDVSDVAWEEPPTFPGLRAERLPFFPAARPVLRHGVRYEVREEVRALFADRPGPIALPGARLACRARAGATARIATPPARLDVIPLPEAGRPAGFDGLVGPLVVRRHVEPRSIALGQAVRVAVTLQGEGNLWDAPAPGLPSDAPGDAEVFPRPPETVLDRGTRLVVRRHFEIDVVPRREGVLRIPPLAWTYFDPDTGSYAEAAVESVDVPVGPAPRPAARPPAARKPEGAETRAPAAGTAGPIAGWIAGASLLVALGAAGWRSRSRRRAVATAVSEALASAGAARAAGDRDGELAALARALRAALAPQLGSAAGLPPEEILAKARAQQARITAELLVRIERARFDPAAAVPDLTAVERVLRGSGAPRRARRRR
jgi:hypothetical protein